MMKIVIAMVLMFAASSIAQVCIHDLTYLTATLPAPGLFTSPDEIAVDLAGNVYTCDDTFLTKQDANGNPFAGAFPIPLRFGASPCRGVSVTPGGTIYVATDFVSQGAVNSYSAAGAPLNINLQFGSNVGPPPCPGCTQSPVGISVNSIGQVYLADTNVFDRVIKYTADLQTTIGTLGPFPGLTGVFVDPDSDLVLWISQAGATNTVSKITIGADAFPDITFTVDCIFNVNGPAQAAVDADWAYFTSTADSTVEVYDKNICSINPLVNLPVQVIGGPGILDDEFNAPEGVTVLQNGLFLYVSDTGNNRVQRYQCNVVVVPTTAPAGSE